MPQKRHLLDVNYEYLLLKVLLEYRKNWTNIGNSDYSAEQPLRKASILGLTP